MANDVQSVPPIARGFFFALRVNVTGGDPAFPAGCQIKADVRDYAGAPVLAGTLTTGDGTILRIDDNTVEMHMTHAITAALGNTSATVDFVRTDLTPDAWIGVQIVLPVVKPVTLPDAGA